MDTPCKIHPNKPGRHGYVQVGRKGEMAHRRAWTENYGPIPDGHIVRHRCDVRACIEPTHLICGTQQQNMDDMVARGRSTRRLTSDEVEAARAKYAAGGVTYQALADEYGVSLSTIYGRITGKSKRPGRARKKYPYAERKHWQDRGRDVEALVEVADRVDFR
jgi:hypothetical protein